MKVEDVARIRFAARRAAKKQRHLPIGNGVFGGLLPLIGLSMCAAFNNIYAGLWYPLIVAGATFVVGAIFLKETHGHKIWDEVKTS